MYPQSHILIADSNPTSRMSLAATLGAAGYCVTEVDSGSDAIALALTRTAGVDLMLVDADLADADGRNVAARVRRRGATLPIVLMSDSADEDEVVCALDSGADDVLVRPLRPRELLARLRAQLRAGAGREEADIRIGQVLFRPASRTLLHPEVARPIRLTEKEAALLQRLCRSEGQPVTRQTLLQEVWGYSPDATSHTVETHIYRLRRKIEPTPSSPAVLVNADGGYRLDLDGAPDGPGWNGAAHAAARSEAGDARGILLPPTPVPRHTVDLHPFG